MEVSIIIPIYNVSKYIERCLRSVLDQTWKDLEVILVDDCTPDDSMDIVRRVLETSPRRSIVTILKHEENRGLSAARNTGIRQATGDYLYFLDSDDYLPENSIELLADAAIQYKVDFVIGDFEIAGAFRKIPPLLLNTGMLIDNKAVLSTFSKAQWTVMACNKLINRSFLIKEHLFFKEGLLHEDDLWSFMVACKACNAYVVKEKTYFYYLQPNSITGRPSVKNLESRVRIIEYLFEYISRSPELRENAGVYITFETLKAKYFDRIIYYSKDRSLHYTSYLSIRLYTYISPLKAVFLFKPGIKLCFRNIHQLLPKQLGYWYFKSFVFVSYKLLILPIKLRQWTGKE